ncbi:MAG: Fur family ferric uptake transcriptional regulator [Myxococcota bacterium]|jgi:Fur family ferric uptake transcriptional regulator
MATPTPQTADIPSIPSTSNSALRHDIRAAGLRATGARIAALRIMREARKPLSHAEVVDRLSDQPWDKATIYRNLIDLATAGLLRRAVMGGRVWRFEDITEADAEAHQHAHFVCTSCGVVECLPDDAVTLSSTIGKGQVDVQVRGACDDCDDTELTT